MNCQKCGNNIPDGTYFCTNCGTPISRNRICKKCGATVADGNVYCTVCGERYVENTYNINSQATYQQDYRVNTTSKSSPTFKIIMAFLIALIIIFVAVLVKYFMFRPDNKPVDMNQTATQAPISTLPPTPIFESYTCSSTRGADTSKGYAIYYYPEYMFDKDFSTCWSPNRNNGTHPYVTLSSGTRQHVTGIKMTNGYCKSAETYEKNSRITKVEIKYEGGSKIATMSAGSYGVMIDIPLDRPVDTSFITIVVLDSITGTWKDISISELEVY